MQFDNSREFILKINQTFHLILAGPLLFFAYIFLTRSKNHWEGIMKNPEYNSLVLFILLPVLVLAAIWSFKNYRLGKKQIAKNLPLKEKLEIFQSLFITFQIYYAIYGFTSLIGLYITGKVLFSGYFISLLFIASMHNPSVNLICRSLNLSKEEKDILKHQKPF